MRGQNPSRKHFRLVLPSALLVARGCQSTPPQPTDSLTAQEAAELDGIPSVDVPMERIVLPDGRRLGAHELEDGFLHLESPATRKSDIIEQMLLAARVMGDRPLWRDVRGADGQIIAAQQQPNGLAYSYGSKDPEYFGPNGNCKFVRGLDCSGMVYQAAAHAGLAIPTGNADLQTQPATWNGALPSDLAMAVLADATPLESGDIVGWTRANGTVKHVGIIERDIDGMLSVHQSNGLDGECDANRGPNRGPRSIAFAEINAWPNFGPPKYRLRIVCDGDEGCGSGPPPTPDDGGGVAPANPPGQDASGADAQSDALDAVTDGSQMDAGTDGSQVDTATDGSQVDASDAGDGVGAEAPSPDALTCPNGSACMGSCMPVCPPGSTRNPQTCSCVPNDNSQCPPGANCCLAPVTGQLVACGATGNCCAGGCCYVPGGPGFCVGDQNACCSPTQTACFANGKAGCCPPGAVCTSTGCACPPGTGLVDIADGIGRCRAP